MYMWLCVAGEYCQIFSSFHRDRKWCSTRAPGFRYQKIDLDLLPCDNSIESWPLFSQRTVALIYFD